jgi:nicotinamidase-related amidase
MQYDFCLPGGALYVSGAENDIVKLADFVERNEKGIDHIILTQDSHQVIDISHPAFWTDKIGRHPDPFTLITPEDIKSGTWSPLYFRDEAVRYVNDLGSRGEFIHTIWPEHCISGSRGASIVDDVMKVVRQWAAGGHFFDLVIKGTNPLTEHFGALRANIPIKSAPETGMNTALADKLRKYGNIYIAGEARSLCS